MERQALADGGVRFSTNRGVLDLWTAPPVLVVRFEGVGDGAFAPPIIEAFDHVRQDPRPMRVFFDMEGVSNYDSALRTELTAHVLKHRERVGGFDLFTKSKLVAMGVSVANLALNGLVTSHPQRDAFVNAFTAALARNNVKTIKSSVLGA
jgi:hypothetical protein